MEIVVRAMAILACIGSIAAGTVASLVNDEGDNV